ncbi:hypothetical protein SDC9_205950 [bioreactor metagenome]|uniref:Uncharacterized protein n=1 Tax=bioreactor metagenome TaxID=1076179 RepID=A0A645J4C7_9ZZZZ
MAHGNAARFIQDKFQVCGGVGCGEVDFLPTLCKAKRDGSGNGGLTYAALAHGEDDALTLCRQFVYHIVQRMDMRSVQRLRMGAHMIGMQQSADVFKPRDVVGP